jgi:hypothetical protein
VISRPSRFKCCGGARASLWCGVREFVDELNRE